MDEMGGNKIDTEKAKTKPDRLNHKKTKPAAHVIYISLYIEIGGVFFHSISFLLQLLSPKRNE